MKFAETEKISLYRFGTLHHGEIYMTLVKGFVAAALRR